MRSFSSYLAPAGILILALSTRFLPHFPNFTAVGAVALLGGFWTKDRPAAFLLPLLLLYVSDMVLNNLLYASVSSSFTWGYPGMVWVYVGHLAMIFWGQNASRMQGIAGAGHAVVANVLFFALSNFGFWLGNPALSQSTYGLLTAYLAAIPFFVSSTAGTLVFGAIMQWAYSKRSVLGIA
ncbi:MAG: hypothetical protein P8N56_02695 [Schleiferiaceae bacterium]|nr:hypothetical protein [Schleiferiaceae bacterium]